MAASPRTVAALHWLPFTSTRLRLAISGCRGSPFAASHSAARYSSAPGEDE
jgi:hypothetical protein